MKMRMTNKEFLRLGIVSFSFLLCVVFTVACNKGTKVSGKSEYSMQVVKEDGYWGYDIRKGKQIVIHQIRVPAVAGEQRFKTKNDARKVGEKVLSNLDNNKPPGVGIKDLEELGVAVIQVKP